MNSARQQRGMGAIGWMFMLVLLGFAAIFVIKLAPAYVEFFNVRSVVRGFTAETNDYASAADVQEAIERRFSINDVKSITGSDVLVEPEAGGYGLRVDYEVRVPFVSNVSLVVKFSEQGRARGVSESP